VAFEVAIVAAALILYGRLGSYPVILLALSASNVP